MKSLVTGGSGFIGSHLVQKLTEAGHDVSVLDLKQPTIDVRWVNADIRSPDGIDLRGYEIVYHLAAIADARRCAELPHECFQTNVMGTHNILSAAVRDDVKRVILASTSWMAGAQVGEIVQEDSPFVVQDVNTIYGASKLSQELICASYYGQFGKPNYTILRYGVPYGERMRKGAVVRAFMQWAEELGKIHIFGDGKQYREFLYVGDMCDAQVKALENGSENKVYNLTGNRPVTVEEIAREVQKHFEAKIEYIPQARVEPKLKRISNDFAKRELKWDPTTSLEDGIALCADWWRSLADREKSEEYWI